MMNLAIRDIRHKLGRFVLTTVGMGLLLMVVMGMGGIYRGLVEEATLVIDRAGADIWVVQKDTKGPFAEVSALPRNMEERIAAMEGVESARPFVSHTIQRDYGGRVLRLTVQGISDDGSWLPLVKGRPLAGGRFEMLADKSAKLPIGSELKLGDDTFKVVGITGRLNSPAGDAMVFVSLNDALAIRDHQPGEAIRNEREARLRRFGRVPYGSTAVDHAETLRSARERPAALPGLRIGAVLAKVRPGWDVEEVMRRISALPDVTAYTADGQREIMLGGVVARSRRQQALFRRILGIVSTVVMMLVLYTLTLDKLHDIAMLHLLGARKGAIIGMILQQALLIGCLSFALACIMGNWAYPHFPRRVVIVRGDQAVLFAVVVGISVLASLVGIRKTLRTDAGEVLS